MQSARPERTAPDTSRAHINASERQVVSPRKSKHTHHAVCTTGCAPSLPPVAVVPLANSNLLLRFF
eukprot:6725558-Prymnesium_polylepis.1